MAMRTNKRAAKAREKTHPEKVRDALLRDREARESLKRGEEQSRRGESTPWREVRRAVRG